MVAINFFIVTVQYFKREREKDKNLIWYTKCNLYIYKSLDLIFVQNNNIT